MAMILPTENSKTFERDPEESRIPTGTYPARLERVSQVGPSKKFPDSGDRLVFEFVVSEGPYRGKKAATFVGKKLWRNAANNKESALLKLARQLGVADPMQGFDPELYIGKAFMIGCELQDDRAWVRFVSPAADAGGGATPAAPPPPSSNGAPPPPPRPSAPVTEYWVMWPEAESPTKHPKQEVQERIEKKAIDIAELQVCLVGDPSQTWKSAKEAGFSGFPF